MLSNLKRRLAGYYTNWTSAEKRTESISFWVKKLQVLPGTIRSTPDQDDAWFTWLCENKKRLFDIGANIGFTALIAGLRRNGKNCTRRSESGSIEQGRSQSHT